MVCHILNRIIVCYHYNCITVLLIEHNMDLVFEVVERLLVLNNGVPVACDTKENIKKNERVQKLYLGDDAEDDDA